MEESSNQEVKQPHSAKGKRGLWKPEEDLILKNYVETHGEGNWAALSKKSGLMRGGKSCRLRWKNYLRPNIKRGEMSQQEEDLIIRMHKLLGNRWSLIAGRLPGRTDNEVKNYWNTHLNKKCRSGKRKATGVAGRDDAGDNKLPPACDDSYNINNTSQGSEGREEQRDAARVWTEKCSAGSFFNCDIDCAVTPLRCNANFVFDDDSFIAYLDSFLAFDTLECNQ